MADEQLVEEGREGAGEISAPKPPPAWGPPRAPLPPHRLAALANALGVSTPSPATQPSTSSMSSSASYSSTSGPSSDHNWRSPTPSSSTNSLTSYLPSTSKFLLHVIPPLHLPHESNCDADNSELTPPPSNASGYHTQFPRGTLVPLHPTLHSQMVAIAKEYALPSTAGMILYLSSSSSAQPSPVDSVTDTNGPDTEEPGPRLSEGIWKHLWSRVLKAEREENLAMSRGPTPNFGLGINLGLKNLSYSPQDVHGPLRPMFSPSLREPTHQHSQTSAYPMSPVPSTPSSTSDLRSHSKSAAPSFSSRSLSADTAETSTGSHTDELEDPRAEGLHLPGLNSPSLIPILAKLEFDIDRRKAGWYEPWLRSRKMNQLKRSEGRKGQSGSDEKAVPIQLKLARKVGKRGGFKPFSESPEHTDTELDDTFEGRSSRKIPPPLVLPDDANDSGDTYLAYLKRDLGVYDDLEGLGEFSYDPHDPHDRRKSQYIMKTKLDEIEKTLAQFSPKHLDQNQSQTDLSNQQLPEPSKVPRSANGSPLKQDGSSSGNESGSWPRRSTSLRAKHHTVRYENAQLSAQGKAKLNEEDVPITPEWSEKPIEKPVDKTTLALRKKQYRNTFKLEGNTIIPRDSAEADAAYPPVPLSSRSTNGVSDSARSVNGISASASKSYMARTNSSDFNNVLASGSTIRRGGHQAEKGLSPPATPVIPLSPDPFGRFASNSATSPLNYTSFAHPSSSDVTENAASSSRFSADSITHADGTKMPKGDKSGASMTSVKGVKKLLKKSRLSISGRQSISLPLSNRPPLPGSPQEDLDWPMTPRSPLPPQATSAPAVKHSRVDSANDHFHFDQESSYPVRQSSAWVSKPSISEHPSSTAPDRGSIRKSILKGWKPPPSQSQLQGSTLEPLAERSDDRPRLNPDESVGRRSRRPSILIATDASALSNPDVRPRPQVQVQYINGRVAGLSERRKSKPANVPPSSTNSPHHSPPPITSLSLAPGASQPKPTTSRTSSKG